jgi:tetratricopeptide (TPR) repeat protein
MNTSSAGKLTRIACVTAASFLVCAGGAWAQSSPLGGGGGSSVPNQTQLGQSGGTMNDQLQYGTMGHEVEREQNAAFQAFSKEHDPAKKIQKGREFLMKYPKSSFNEQVDAGLMDTYRTQADWNNEYHYADQALTLNPNDVDVLATVGWTIPHVLKPSDTDADQELDKAEKFAKHAIEVLAALPKPHDLTEAQFTAAKARRTYQAHSALGLVYFRRNDYDDSAKELALATKDNPNPDQTDLFVLGADLQNLSRFGEAADAFGGCAQIAGALQNQCKQSADAAKRQADVSKAK